MNLRKLLPLFLLAFTASLSAIEPVTNVKLYGFVSNDFFYNSRQNVELIDGIIQLFPKPISLNKAGNDINAVPQAEMLSIITRIGIDITSAPILNAKSSGKIEADFAGFGANYYVFRIRQAYMKLNWSNTELLLGQAWHPFFSTTVPSTLSLNAGAPFQPFNRSPQLKLKHNFSSSLSSSIAALYQMQFASQGPLGTSNLYLKNTIMPELFLGFDSKSGNITTGIGVDYKTIKPDQNSISSLSLMGYTQFVNSKFQFKAKAIYGQNLSDQLMLGGYGVSKYSSDSKSVLEYTNFNTGSAWLNAVYGTKFQLGLLFGIAQNFGTSENLERDPNIPALNAKRYVTYGYGFYDMASLDQNLVNTDSKFYDKQILDKLYRIAPQVVWNLQNIKLGVEYDFSSADFGTMNFDGTVMEKKAVKNHRILATVKYNF